LVHGSGPADRTGSGTYLPVMERMARAGYATFSWDKPGTGESTGELSSRRVHSQRARIVLEAVEVLKAHPAIDGKRIGVWGTSQAGSVMQRVLMQTDDIAFMICVSCAAISSDDPYAYQVTALALCQVPEEKAAQTALLHDELDKARAHETYEEYLRYRRALEALAQVASVSLDNWPALTEASWQKSDPNFEAYWNPIEAIEQTRIPVLAIYGEQDRQIDPLQGVTGYRSDLEQAGNPKPRVELFPRAGHGIAVSETGCPADDLQWIEQFAKAQGYDSLDEAQKAIGKDPRLQDALAPGYLDMHEEWLRTLRPCPCRSEQVQGPAGFERGRAGGSWTDQHDPRRLSGSSERVSTLAYRLLRSPDCLESGQSADPLPGSVG
jgi:uncharacterized protein